MARRLVERGVRFVQLYIESQIFDTHSNLQTDLNLCVYARPISRWPRW